MLRSAEITAAHIIRLFLNPLSSADLKYFSVSIICWPFLFMAYIPTESLTLYNEMYLFGECPLGLLLFRRPSK